VHAEDLMAARSAPGSVSDMTWFAANVKKPDIWGLPRKCANCGWRSRPEDPVRRVDAISPLRQLRQACPVCGYFLVCMQLTQCPKCGGPLRLKPHWLQSFEHFLSKEMVWSCRHCGCDFDKWGRNVIKGVAQHLAERNRELAPPGSSGPATGGSGAIQCARRWTKKEIETLAGAHRALAIWSRPGYALALLFWSRIGLGGLGILFVAAQMLHFLPRLGASTASGYFWFGALITSAYYVTMGLSFTLLWRAFPRSPWQEEFRRSRLLLDLVGKAAESDSTGVQAALDERAVEPILQYARRKCGQASSFGYIGAIVGGVIFVAGIVCGILQFSDPTRSEWVQRLFSHTTFIEGAVAATFLTLGCLMMASAVLIPNKRRHEMEIVVAKLLLDLAGKACRTLSAVRSR
jgi:hypothetical protein